MLLCCDIETEACETCGAVAELACETCGAALCCRHKVCSECHGSPDFSEMFSEKFTETSP
jgi:hypothetical protein